MHAGYTTLSDKEKAALRLLVRGHDAKSSARELGLSVHTVNERLRDARRKLGVTSSRAAARIVLAAEAGSPELLGDKPLGGASAAGAAAQGGASTTGHLPLIGVTAMSALIAALLLVPASPLSVLPAGLSAGVEAPADAEGAAAAHAAERWMGLLDESRWEESYTATGAQFQALNTLEVWTEVNRKVRSPLGAVVKRTLVSNDFVPAPPQGYRMIRFRTNYAAAGEQVETLSLAWEDGAWKVAGITIE